MFFEISTDTYIYINQKTLTLSSKETSSEYAPQENLDPPSPRLALASTVSAANCFTISS